MSAGPTDDEIKEALSQSGYLMEQEVASQLERLSYRVSTNFPFQDPDEGKSREIDVRAIRRIAFDEDRKIAAFIEIVVECKNSDNPYVFITRNKNSGDNKQPPKEWLFPLKSYEMINIIGQDKYLHRKSPFFHLGFEDIRWDYKSENKAVQFCRIDRNGRNGWQANHGGLYDSIFFPLAKAVTSRLNDAPKSGNDSEDWKYFWFIFPLVVLSGRLVVVDSNENTPQPRDVEFVNFKRDLKSKSLNGRFSVDFVRQEYLESYHNQCIEPIALYISNLVSDQADRIFTKEIPWVESE